VIRQAAPLPQHERVELLGRILTGHDLPLRPRVAAAIVLLYAQPLSRVVRLTLDDVIHDGDQVLLRLGEPPSPVPGPVADLLLSWIDKRDNMNTATKPQLTLAVPRTPMHSDALAALVDDLGIPTVARPGLRDPPARPGDARPRCRRRPRLPPGSPPPNSRPKLGDLEPVRLRGPPAVTIGLGPGVTALTLAQ
jgi:hypothetical protein